MPKAARRTAAAFVAAALLVLTGHAAVAATGGPVQAATSAHTQGMPCGSCGG